MCDPISMGLMIGGGLFNAQNELSAGQMSKAGYEMAAKQVEWQRDRDIETVREAAKEIAGSQQAAMAANGVDIGSVTGQDILLDTKTKEGLDEVAIKYAANLQTLQLRTQGRQAEIAGETRALTSLLGTAGQVADSWNRWKQTGRGKTGRSRGINDYEDEITAGITRNSKYKAPGIYRD